MKVVVVGATDLTLAVVEVVAALPDVELVGCIGAPSTIRVSYAPGGRANVRHADLEAWSEARGIAFHRFVDNATLRDALAGWDADLAVVAGWFHLVPRSVRDRFPMGVLGLHASLLPQLRGGAPLNWAILSGATETGISLFVLTDGVDEGPLYGQAHLPIGPRTTIADLVASSTDAGLDLLRDALPRIARGELQPTEQHGVPSYTLHREPDDARIDWRRSAEEIDRLVRAVTRPYPGAIATLDGDELLIWATELPTDLPVVWSEPGGILRLPGQRDPVVVTGDGLLLITDATDRDGTDVMDRLRAASYRRFR